MFIANMHKFRAKRFSVHIKMGKLEKLKKKNEKHGANEQASEWANKERERKFNAEKYIDVLKKR